MTRAKPSLTLLLPAALLTVLLPACAESRASEIEREPIVGGPCERCDGVFVGMPDEVPAQARIAPPDEPGEPLTIEGRVLRQDGTPAPGTIVYAYQTDAGGIYPRDPDLRGTSAYRHGKLRGWARADEDGRYRFDTIRPGGYPSSRVPQHIHMHVIEPGCCTYYIDDIHFRDDPRLPEDEIRRYDRGRGGSGVVMPRTDGDSGWVVGRDIVLGQGVSGYPPAAGR